MYVEALAEERIFGSGKMVLKLGFMLMALAVFSNHNMFIAAYETGGVLRGYVQENIMLKEQSDDALFLLQNEWNDNLKQKYGNHQIKQVDDGVIYVSMLKNIKSRKVKINVAEVNKNINKNLEIVPIMSLNKMHSKSKIKNIASENEALIAINGGYFKQDTGTPLGTLVINNEIITGPMYDRAGFGITKDGFKTARISFYGELKTKSEHIKIDNINQPRILQSQVLIYNSKWGKTTPNTIIPMVHMVIQNNKITAKHSKSAEIPQDGYVICAKGEILNNFKIGEKVSIEYRLNPQWENVEHIIGGGPYLIKEGKTYIDTANEKLNAISGRNPRTAIGYTRENVMIMVTVDGRKEGNSGVTINELAKIMLDLDCYEAINLDGGSSTVMYVDGQVYSGTNIRNSVAVSNALVVKQRA